MSPSLGLGNATNKKNNISSGGSVPVLWTPEQIPLTAWYDFDDDDSITLIPSTNLVNICINKALISDLDLRISDQNTAPTLLINHYNNRNGINFNPSKVLSTNTTNTTVLYNYQFTITVLFSTTSTWSDYHSITERTDVQNNRIGGLMELNNTGIHFNVFPLEAWKNGVNVNVAINSLSPINLRPFIYAVSHSGDKNAYFTSIGNYNFVQGGAAIQYEVITTPTVPSISDRQKLEGYLAHKWGLTGDLPPTHPYKNNPPYV